MCTTARSSAAGPAGEASPLGGAIAARAAVWAARGERQRGERERVKLLSLLYFTRVKGHSYGYGT
jgi:hypothetical protein